MAYLALRSEYLLTGGVHRGDSFSQADIDSFSILVDAEGAENNSTFEWRVKATIGVGRFSVETFILARTESDPNPVMPNNQHQRYTSQPSFSAISSTTSTLILSTTVDETNIEQAPTTATVHLKQTKEVFQIFGLSGPLLYLIFGASGFMMSLFFGTCVVILKRRNRMRKKMPPLNTTMTTQLRKTHLEPMEQTLVNRSILTFR